MLSFRLSLLLLGGGHSLAIVSVLMFCISPASVFFTALYTESPFAALSFGGMLALFRSNKSSDLLVATFLFLLASAFRGNGLLLAGFILVRPAQQLVLYLLSTSFFRSSRLLGRDLSQPQLLPSDKLFSLVLISGVLFLLCFLPFLLFQWYAFQAFCIPHDDSSDSVPAWCKRTFPSVYGHVQSHYWGNGLFAYFQLKQIPNFLLAAPVLLASFSTLFNYISEHGLVYAVSLGVLPARNAHNIDSPTAWLPASLPLLALVMYTAFLAIFAFLFMNVQVATRFICSSSPLLYWTAALALLHSRTVQGSKAILGLTSSRLYSLWFLGYLILGICLFCTFLPWT